MSVALFVIGGWANIAMAQVGPSGGGGYPPTPAPPATAPPATAPPATTAPYPRYATPQAYPSGYPQPGYSTYRPAAPAAVAARPSAPSDTASAMKGAVEGESDQNGSRTLKGHTFHYPRLLDNAFTAANFYVGSSIEFYSQEEVISTFDLSDGTVKEFQYDRELGFVRLRFGTDFAFGDSFTIGVDADYLAEVGTNEQTLFLYGGKTGFDLQPNLKIRLVRSESAGSQLALGARAVVNAGIRAVPQGLLRELAAQITEIAADQQRATCLVEADFECAFAAGTNLSESVRLTQERYGAVGVLSYAQALNRYLGGQLSLSLGGTSNSLGASYLGELSSSSLLFSAGLAPALNLYPKAPVGMAFEYRFELENTSYQANEAAGLPEAADVSANSHRLGWGLYYTGRRDLMLGWIAGINFVQDTTRSLQEAVNQPDAFIFAAQFDMRYFF